MDRYFIVALAAFGLMQITLAVPANGISAENDREFSGNVHGILPASGPAIEKVECDSGEHLVRNLDYLSDLISAVELLPSWIDFMSIVELNESVNSKELGTLVQNLIAAANAYRSETEDILDRTVGKLLNLTEAIHSDTEMADFVESKIALLKDANKLRESCAKVNEVEIFLKKFGDDINSCMKKFEQSVAPHATKINTELEELATIIRAAELEQAKQKINELTTLLITEKAATESRATNAWVDLDACITVKGSECEAYLNNIQTQIKDILK